MENTKISWTHHTFNPWIGCTKVSAGCQNCYAEKQGLRQGVPWGAGNQRKRTSEDYWNQALAWNEESAARKEGPLRVFCASMADVFDVEVAPQWRTDLFDLVQKTPHIQWQFLTKRPKLAVRYAEKHGWPDNVWIGASVESQEYVGRAEEIAKIPAPIRFLSVEPLLGPVKLKLKGIDWVILGGESGPNHRSMAKGWVLDVKQQCEEAGIPFFFKQWASARSDSLGHLLDGDVYHAFPIPKVRNKRDGGSSDSHCSVKAFSTKTATSKHVSATVN